MIQDDSLGKFVDDYEKIENGIQFIAAAHATLFKCKSRVVKSFFNHVLFENPETLYPTQVRMLSSHFKKKAVTKFENNEFGLYNQFFTAHLFLSKIATYMEELS